MGITSNDNTNICNTLRNEYLFRNSPKNRNWPVIAIDKNTSIAFIVNAVNETDAIKDDLRSTPILKACSQFPTIEKSSIYIPMAITIFPVPVK